MQIFEETSQLNWKLGIVGQLNKGKNGLKRSVTLQMKNGTTSRPISKLYPLELNAQEDDNRDEDPYKRTERAAKLAAMDRMKIWNSKSCELRTLK